MNFEMTLADRLQKLKKSLPAYVTLVAVSKTKPVSDLMEAYKAGQRVFGENKVQEMVGKFNEMPKDIKWHMIGNLQRNKVKYMASFVHLIHGVDSLKLLKEINKQAQKNERVIECLMQIKIACESTKSGMSSKEAENLLNSDYFKALKHIKITGIMGMASFTEDKIQISKEFKNLKSAFKTLKEIQKNMGVISMGMSGDYPLAIECGSNMIRVGSLIFGNRQYT
jgi:hypothetical protein